MHEATDQGVAPPVCFMHIRKSGGQSVHAALLEVLPPGSFAPKRNDASFFSDFEDYHLLEPEQRARFAITSDEMSAMRGYRAVSGHFCLHTLLQIAPSRSVCTVLREPRARLLSVYMHWRVPGSFDRYAPYRIHLHALRPLKTVLAEPKLAQELDNVVCRRVLSDDPRLPPKRFARQCDVAGIASDAIRRLETLGFVGILELDESTWRGLGAMFSVTLCPSQENVTGAPWLTPQRLNPGEVLFDAETSDLLAERSAADRIVYDYIMSRTVDTEPDRVRIRMAAFAKELVKYGELVGPLAKQGADASVSTQGSEDVVELRAELDRTQAELEQARQWLTSIQASASWRATSPLRAAKRRLSATKSDARDWQSR